MDGRQGLPPAWMGCGDASGGTARSCASGHVHVLCVLVKPAANPLDLAEAVRAGSFAPSPSLAFAGSRVPSPTRVPLAAAPTIVQGGCAVTLWSSSSSSFSSLWSCGLRLRAAVIVRGRRARGETKCMRGGMGRGWAGPTHVVPPSCATGKCPSVAIMPWAQFYTAPRAQGVQRQDELGHPAHSSTHPPTHRNTTTSRTTHRTMRVLLLVATALLLQATPAEGSWFSVRSSRVFVHACAVTWWTCGWRGRWDLGGVGRTLRSQHDPGRTPPNQHKPPPLVPPHTPCMPLPLPCVPP